MTRSTSIRRPLIYSVLTPKPSVLIPSQKMTLTHLLNNLLSRRKGASNLIKLNEIDAMEFKHCAPPVQYQNVKNANEPTGAAAPWMDGWINYRVLMFPPL